MSVEDLLPLKSKEFDSTEFYDMKIHLSKLMLYAHGMNEDFKKEIFKFEQIMSSQRIQVIESRCAPVKDIVRSTEKVYSSLSTCLSCSYLSLSLSLSLSSLSLSLSLSLCVSCCVCVLLCVCVCV